MIRCKSGNKRLGGFEVFLKYFWFLSRLSHRKLPIMNRFKKIMLTTLVVIGCLVAAVFLFMQQKTFGDIPSGTQLARIQQSSHYKNGTFENLSDTPMMAEEGSTVKMIAAYWNKPNTEPSGPIPFVKTNLKAIESDKPVIVWFGHSSYFLRINGKNILLDPVFSGSASPLSFMVKSYAGANEYSAEDFPELDAVILSHDHYDHLDYETIVKLIPKVKHFYTSLGVGAHLQRWGVQPTAITELDWSESTQLSPDMSLMALPARHFSGRGFSRGKAFWSSFVLKSLTHNLYLGGDSGYDTHFKEIGDKYGPFDIAILEAGQYNQLWKLIHMMPEETVQASLDLRAKVLMPVHWGKFTLALHPWNEPVERVFNKAKEVGQTLTTPLIGEPVVIDSVYPNKPWWRF